MKTLIRILNWIVSTLTRGKYKVTKTKKVSKMEQWLKGAKNQFDKDKEFQDTIDEMANDRNSGLSESAELYNDYKSSSAFKDTLHDPPSELMETIESKITTDSITLGFQENKVDKELTKARIREMKRLGELKKIRNDAEKIETMINDSTLRRMLESEIHFSPKDKKREKLPDNVLKTAKQIIEKNEIKK